MVQSNFNSFQCDFEPAAISILITFHPAPTNLCFERHPDGRVKREI